MKMSKAKWAYGGGGVADARTGQTVSTNDLGSPRLKNKVEAHTAPTKYGMGNYYGTGFKAQIGRMRSGSVGYRPVSRKQLGTPPKNVV